jgi:hypothetical protein
VKLMVQPQDGVKPLIDGIHRARSPNSGRAIRKLRACVPGLSGRRRRA